MDNDVLYHRATCPWAFPLDARRLEVTVRMPRGDGLRAFALHRDRYAPAFTSETPLTPMGEDGRAAYARGVLEVPTHRAAYVLRIEGPEGTVYLGEDGTGPDASSVKPFEVPYIHEADLFRPPAWLDDAIFYQVFPDRFRNGDPANDPPGTEPWGTPPGRGTVCGGDLSGIRESISYLCDLGATALYTTPIFRAPSNHKYDTADYETVDPAFGTNDDLVSLSADLHAAGLRLVLDGVFNHSGREWFTFEDVRAHGEASAYAPWFQDVRFPVDIQAVNYETFSTGVSRLPKLNPDAPSLREYLLLVAGRWTGEAALDGWRLDVGNEVSLSFWRAFRERIRTVNPEAFLLVESWSDSLDFLRGDTFDAATNYPWRAAALGFVTGRATGTATLQAFTRVRMLYPSIVANACVNLLGSHDTPRIRTVAGSPERTAMAAVLLFTSPGVPLVYYGDEVGLEGGGDPDCRRCFPWDNPAARNAAITDVFRRLFALRRAHPWLRTCHWQARTETGADVLAYTCASPDGRRIDVLLNRGGETAILTADGPWESALDGRRGSGPVAVPPEGAAVLVSKAPDVPSWKRTPVAEATGHDSTKPACAG